MKRKESLALCQKVLAPRELSDIEKIVFLNSWDGKLYREIAEEQGYQEVKNNI